MNKLRMMTASMAIAGLVCTPALAQKSEVQSASEGEWLSLKGEVVSVTGERFTLDYGDSEIVVEMDDFDPADDNRVVTGDRVTVTGRADTDLVTNKTLEANSVYVEALNEYFYAGAADEEDGYYSAEISDQDNDGGFSIAGEVVSIEGEQFTLDAGAKNYVVDIDEMDYDPLDEEGRERIELGERVVVSGEIDNFELFSGEEIEADAVTTLSASGS